MEIGPFFHQWFGAKFGLQLRQCYYQRQRLEEPRAEAETNDKSENENEEEKLQQQARAASCRLGPFSWKPTRTILATFGQKIGIKELIVALDKKKQRAQSSTK